MDSLKRRSLTAVNFLRPVWTMVNDVVLNIRTTPSSTEVSCGPDPAGPTSFRPFAPPTKHEDNFGYDSPEYWYLYRIARRLKLAPDDVFYDIGCGMGRVLCIVARRQIRRCVGIELFEPLCQTARRNALSLWGRKTPIEICCADAATADLADGTVYYLYHPFGENTLRDFLNNLQTSISQNPRTVTVVYYNSVYESNIEASGWLKKSHEFYTFSGQHVTFWKGSSGRSAT